MTGSLGRRRPNMDTHLPGFAQPLFRGLPVIDDAWAGVRETARKQAFAAREPGPREESWRFTDLGALYRGEFDAILVPPAAVLEVPELPEAGHRLVFVDGHLIPGLSRPAEGGGLEVRPVSGADAHPGDPIPGTLVPASRDLFAALNLARLATAALVHVRRGCAAPAPVHLVFLYSTAAHATFPRVMVRLEPGASCSIVEEHHARTGQAHLCVPVTELELGNGAQLTYTRVLRQGAGGFSLGYCEAVLGREAQLDVCTVSADGRLTRLDLGVRFAGPGARVGLDGLAKVDGNQVADTHSRLIHGAPNCRSRQLHKCVAAGAGRVVFNGAIRVEHGAQQTDAAQQSRSLLLSPRARVDAKPQLEIFADDVKCAHGATVGQLDDEQLFYLRARGLAAPLARELLTYAFAAEVLRRVPVASLRRRLERELLAHTPG